MSRPATYEPLVIAELKKAGPGGISRRDLREKVGCSSQQIHKIVEKGKLPEGHRQHLPIVTIGKGEFGSDLVAWNDAVVEPVEGTRREHELPQLGQRLRVVGLTVEGDVTVETDEGHRLTLRG